MELQWNLMHAAAERSEIKTDLEKKLKLSAFSYRVHTNGGLHQ